MLNRQRKKINENNLKEKIHWKQIIVEESNAIENNISLISLRAKINTFTITICTIMPIQSN